MAQRIDIQVTESVLTLRQYQRTASITNHNRIKMLLLISKGIESTKVLSAKTGISVNVIALWKKTYKQGGFAALVSDARGGDRKSGIDAATKKKIEAKLSDPKDAFTSFGEAQAWINEEFGLSKKYHAVNKYLKRNFGAKLKVGRKSHIKKDESAVAVFKNDSRTSKIYKKQ